MNYPGLGSNEQEGKVLHWVAIQRLSQPQDKLQSLLIEEIKNVRFAPLREALIQSIEETLVEAF